MGVSSFFFTFYKLDCARPISLSKTIPNLYDNKTFLLAPWTFCMYILYFSQKGIPVPDKVGDRDLEQRLYIDEFAWVLRSFSNAPLRDKRNGKQAVEGPLKRHKKKAETSSASPLSPVEQAELWNPEFSALGKQITMVVELGFCPPSRYSATEIGLR